MASHEDISSLQERLQIHRRTLKYYLKQKAEFGEAYTPPAVMHGIENAREEILYIKRVLRSWNIHVDDHPDDVQEKRKQTTPSPSPKIITRKQRRNRINLFIPIGLGVLLAVTISVIILSMLRQSNGLLAVDTKPSTVDSTKIIPPETITVTIQPSQQVLPTSMPDSTISELNIVEALKMAYGTDNVQQYSTSEEYIAKWVANEEYIKSTNSKQDDNIVLRSNIIASYTYDDNGITKLIIIGSTREDTAYICHQCGSSVDGFIFSPFQGSWKLVTRQFNFTQIGYWTEAPKGKSIKIGPSKYAASFETSDVTQGIELLENTVVTEYENHFTVAARTISYMRLSSDCKSQSIDPNQCWGYESKINFVQGKSQEYYNLVIETIGTKLDSDYKTIIPVNEKKILSFNGTEYIEIVNP